MESDREIFGSSKDGTISYIRLTNDRLEEALYLLEKYFYPYECVSIASDVAKNPKAVAELNLLAAECIQEGVSIIAIHNETNKIIGVSVNKIQEISSTSSETFFEKFAQEKCKEKESISLINTMVYCDSSTNLFEYLKVNKVLELMFVAVSADYSKRGVGTDLVKYDLKLLEKLFLDENGPKAATALFTSSYSQRIGEKLDFDVILTIHYRTFSYDGVKFSDKIDNKHKTVKLEVKKCITDVDLSEIDSRV